MKHLPPKTDACFPDDWELAHGLNPDDPNDRDLDNDQDGLPNPCECQCNTDPADPNSYLKVKRIAVSGEARIEFIAETNLTYTVEYAESLENIVWRTLTDVVAGPTSRTVVLSDSAATAQRFYRLVTPRMSNGD